MPRANRRRRDVTSLSIERALGGTTRTERHRDGLWHVRRVTGAGPVRTYRCPGCEQTFDGTRPHVVAWPADGLGSLADRRHWHTPCWQARGRRTPGGVGR